MSWWAQRLGVQPVPEGTRPAPGPTGFPQKAVRWQDSYPPTTNQPPPEPVNADNADWYTVRRQGFIERAPASVGHTGRCPGCGGGNYFRRKWANTECAPLCTDCGYNGDLFTQSGTLLNGIGMKSSGPVNFARSDNPGGKTHFEVDPGVPGDFNFNSIR
jgi:hypothetical protein